MARCKECDREISRSEDGDVCPFCGCVNPIDENYRTKDFTSLTLEKTQSDYKLYKSKERKKAALLCLFLGFGGAHNFYLGFNKKGIISILLTLILTLGIGLPLFLTVWPSALSFVLPFAAVYAAYAFYSIRFFFGDTIKDAKGEFLR